MQLPSNVFCSIYFLTVLTNIVSSKILVPPYFNLVVNRKIDATATCGVFGDNPPEHKNEEYCILTGASINDVASGARGQVIQGQFCDVCNPDDENKAHPIKNAIDGTHKWWQSPPLSRSLDYNEVNITIDLNQEFHVAYLYITMGNSPRPATWVLERSSDYGKTYKPWQYFAEHSSECLSLFSTEANKNIESDDQVLCSTSFSKAIPLEGGEMLISLVNNRPSSKNFTNSDNLQEWTRATNIRFRLLRTKSLLGHLMALSRQDPSVTRRYFYSIRDISVGGRCVCNGHANDCETQDLEANKQVCSCEHNTCGDQCQECCPGFVQKKWRQNRENNEFQCEPCQCNGHSESCHYDEEIDRLKKSIDIHGNYDGGGVCDDCQQNTEGINCEKCVAGFYHPIGVDITDENACVECNCDLRISTGKCAEGTGVCECKENFSGAGCTQCAIGYTNYPLCEPCKCNVHGRADNACVEEFCNCKPGYATPYCDSCDQGFYGFPNCSECDCEAKGILDYNCDKVSGQCQCREGYSGKRCDEIEIGYFEENNEHLPCDCSDKGVTDEICTKQDGKCICKPNYNGEKCDECAPGHYNYPFCYPCECNLSGSQSENCTFFGVKQCLCKEGRGGPSCDQCAPGYFQFPDCLPCECNEAGSTGLSCDLKSGKCRCKPNFVGEKCDECAANLFNFPICEECNCNPIGVMPQFAGCDKKLRNVTSICPCKDHVTGRQCDKCKDNYYGLGSDILKGCTPCECSKEGSLNELSICDPQTGKCLCKQFAGSKSCSECEKGSYLLKGDNILGCEPCECRIGSSINNICDTETGTCSCLPNIIGDKCDEPDTGYYIDDLHSLKYEIEDGYTSNRNSVRYEFESEAFPNFSWKGYVRFKELENQVSLDINVEKPGSYRMLLRYMSKNPDLEELFITVKEQDSDDEQSTPMHLQSSFKPDFTTVTRNQVNAVTFELERAGKYTVTFKTNSDEVYIDYFVLLPSEYYEPSLLKKNVEKICETKTTEPCILNTYLEIDSFTSKVLADDPKFDSRKESLMKYFKTEDSEKEKFAVPVDEFYDLTFELKFPRAHNYILLVEFFNSNEATKLNVNVDHESNSGSQDGYVNLYKCEFSSLCRQIVISTETREPLIVDAFQKADVTLKTIPRGNALIYRIIPVPKERFDYNYIKMAPKCILKDKECLPIEYTSMPDLIREEIATGAHEERSDLNTNILNGKQLEINNKDTNLVYLNDYFKGTKFPLVKTGHKIGNNQGYVMLIHYYQPNHPIVNVTVNIDETYKGSFQASFCPSTSGCRSIIVFENSEIFDYEKSRFVSIQLASHDKDIWLNYALVGPSTSVTPDLKKPAPIDLISEFITKCASQNFKIDVGKNEFCDQALFSLSSKYNNGAKPCDCNREGSKNSETCENFGGQCECKDNVVGRQCTKCKPGYYGFQDCRKCNCPGRNCDEKTGKCSCPANVVQNDDCNTCIPGYYGFHPEHGCVACDCNKEGTISSSLNLCDVKTGQCQCKTNIGGLSCEKCKPGFYGYPYCRQCECNVNGTTEAICNSYGHCSCKDNLHDPYCETCVDGTFNLESRNPKGCTKCFCFGHTQRCDSSSYYNFKPIIDMDENAWKTNKMSGLIFQSSESGGLFFTVEKDTLDKPNEPIYWVAPRTYLGKKLYSYGGSIRYKLLFRSNDGKTHLFSSPDVILEGEGMTISYRSLKQPTSGETFSNTIDILESQFTHLSTGAVVTREQLMIILRNLSKFHIRAGSYTQSLSSAELVSVEMDLAIRKDEDEDYEQNKDKLRSAKSVERCECPATYQGLSCESCQPGYYKLKGVKVGSFTCIPCNCNGRAATCDEETGQCINCIDNTEGKNCEKCKSGYYNDGYGCERCPCPGPLKNFAHNCTALADNTVQCNCQKGYTGQFCSSCAAGYYGNPLLPIESDEGKCLPCNCNGNIDMNDIRSCDQRNGKCLKCLRNTAGDNCELCKDWHYGDPILAKNCMECKCDKCGSETCDIATGTCTCKNNVKGMNCNSCAENTWGFSSCNGCKNCSCDPIGSLSQQCDTFTGNCFCKPGVTGKHCDMCEPDYWNFTTSGCQACNCEKYGVQSGMSGISCNSKTGDCKCIPGVKGKYCDECDDRWILVKHKGCMECDTCVHTLLDDADELHETAKGIENRNSSLAVKANSRLAQLETLYYELKSLSTPTNLDEAPLLQLQKRIKKISENHLPDLTFIPYDIDDKMKTFNTTYNEARLFNEQISDLRMRMDEITSLMGTLERLKQEPDILDEEVEYLKGIIDEILNKKFNETTVKLRETVDQVIKDKKEADGIIMKYETQIKDLETINNKTAYIENSISELKEIIEKAKNAEKFKEKDVSFKAYIESFNKLKDESKNVQDNTDLTYDSVKGLLQSLKDGLNDAKNGLTDLETAVNSLDNMQINHNNKIQELEEKLKTARQKSDSLLQMSNEWERRIKSSQAGLAAFEIATVYDSIATTLNTAYTKSKEVLENYEKANERLSKYLSEFESLKARSDEYSKKLGDLENEQEKSEKTLLDLVRRHNELDQRLSILNKEVENIESWVNKTQKNENILNEIEKSLIQQENELKQSSLKSKELQATIQTIELLKNNDKSDLETISNAKKMNDSINKLKNLNDQISGRVTYMSINYRSLDEKLVEINNEINALKLLIESTRNIANEIKVAVKFRNSSYIKLRSAPVFMPSMSTIGSLYLNTTDANVPISVLYNRNDPNAYLALYLKDGAAHMQYRLSENAKVNTIKTSQAINNGQWYKLEVERIGRLGRLKVYNSRGDTITSSQIESDDQNLIFNIDSINANFYLGQFKFPGEMPKGLLALTNDGFFKNQFEGGIDTVTMNRHSFGLWNHDDSKEIEGEIKRSRAETESSLINSKLPVHFNENSFLCTNKTISLALRRIKRFDVTLKFKSTNTNGILWYGRDDRDKIKINIYLENGRVAVELTSIRENNKNIILDSNNNDRWNSERKLTDNKYHVIQVLISFEVAKSVAISVFEKEILDHVSGELELSSITRPLEAKSFGATHICVGGIPESYAEPNAAKGSFVGCFEYYFSRNIDNERIYLQQELLKVSTTSSRVDTKCPDVLDQCAFNQNPDPVYVSFSEGIDSIEDLASFGISFIPRFSNGTLLFIRQKETQDLEAVNYIYLYLENLHVNLVVKNTKHILKLKSKLKVNYNDLNHVYVLKNDRDFTLNTNDVLEKEQLPEKIRIFTNSELFVGGVPKSLRIGINDKFNNFQGCVVDIFYKNKPLKFQLASSKSNGLSFSRCYTPSFESISLGNSEKPLVKLFAEKSNKKTSLKDESCSLNKEYDQSVTKPVGIRFGLTRYSHMEVLDDNKLNNIISLKFRTVLNEGLIFYASDLRFEKYIAIWLKDGYLNYAFDTGSSFTHIASKKQYNDGRYHTLIATRSSLEGTLRILDKTNTTVLEILQERSSGNDELLNFIGPYYIGGLSEAIFNRISDSQKNIISIEAFVGCMSEFVIGAKKLELLKNRVKKIETMNCSNTHESGIFFTGTSQATHASFKSQISMKDAFELELDVKSRTKNGIILYIGPEDYKSNKDFATLELVNGELIYQIYFGGILNSIKYTPKETNNELCNSNWIRIKIKKSSNGKILLNIKNEEFISNKGDLLPSSAKNNVLYLGGLPNLDLYMKSTISKEPFVGCIRDLIINQGIMKNHKILLDLKLEDGVLNYCPLK